MKSRNHLVYSYSVAALVTADLIGAGTGMRIQADEVTSTNSETTTQASQNDSSVQVANDSASVVSGSEKQVADTSVSEKTADKEQVTGTSTTDTNIADTNQASAKTQQDINKEVVTPESNGEIHQIADFQVANPATGTLTKEGNDLHADSVDKGDSYAFSD